MRNRGLTGVGIALLALFAATAWVVWQGRDLDALEDADLRVELLPTEPHDNALLYLEKAAEALVWPEEADEVTVFDALDGDLDAQARLAGLVDDNAEALESLEAALRAPLLQVPELESFDDPQPDLLAWRRLGQVLALRALEVAPKQGLGDLYKSLDYAYRVESANGGNLRHVLTGVAIRRDALAAFQSWIEMTPIARGDSHRMANRLGGYETDPAVWGRAWAAEYQALKRTLARRHVEGGLPVHGAGLPSLLPEGFRFQPKRTASAFADAYRTLTANGEELCSELAPLGPEASGRELLPRRNAVGEALLASARPGLERFPYRRCTVDTRLAATQVMAGVRAYWDVHHDLPETLDLLVPDYLDALPADPFDGETLRWNLKHAWVYSVGDDFRDEGGRISLVPDDISEPTYRFLFCASPFGERKRPSKARRHRTQIKRRASLAAADGLQECRATF